jgi:hypothetical protein
VSVAQSSVIDFSQIPNPIRMVEADLSAPRPNIVLEPAESFTIPTYDPDLPIPASALDGFVFDELPVEGQEVLEAITHVETANNVEAESEVLDAVESMSHRFQTAVPIEDSHDESLT